MTGKNERGCQFVERSEDKKTLVRPGMGEDQIGSAEFLTADTNQVQVKGACFILDCFWGTSQRLFDRLALGQELPGRALGRKRDFRHGIDEACGTRGTVDGRGEPG